MSAPVLTAPAWQTIPAGYAFAGMGRCRTCPATIAWLLTPSGRRSPHDADGTSHFATCPTADQHRRKP